VEYGGYHNLENYKVTKEFKIEDFIEYTLAMIMVKGI
jgi:hypothetical protein